MITSALARYVLTLHLVSGDLAIIDQLPDMSPMTESECIASAMTLAGGGAIEIFGGDTLLVATADCRRCPPDGITGCSVMPLPPYDENHGVGMPPEPNNW